MAPLSGDATYATIYTIIVDIVSTTYRVARCGIITKNCQ
jgi:hypothetical protein